MNYEWHPIPGTDGKYWALPDGAIRGPRKLLKPTPSPKGYLTVCVPTRDSKYNKFVHRLIALTFFGPLPMGMEVNHKDGNKQNNSVDNLEYCSSSDNKKHAYAIGLKTPSNIDRRGFLSPNGKRVSQFSIDGTLICEFGSARDAARSVGVRYQNIQACCVGKQKTAANSIWRYSLLLTGI